MLAKEQCTTAMYEEPYSKEVRISYAGLFLIELTEEDGQTYFLGEVNDTDLLKDPPQYSITLPGGAYHLPDDPKEAQKWQKIGFVRTGTGTDENDIRGTVPRKNIALAKDLAHQHQGIPPYPVYELWEEVLSRLPDGGNYTLADLTDIISEGAVTYSVPARSQRGEETQYISRVFRTVVKGDLAKTILETARTGDTGLCLVPTGAIHNMVHYGAAVMTKEQNQDLDSINEHTHSVDTGTRILKPDETVREHNISDDTSIPYADTILITYKGNQVRARFAPTWELVTKERTTIPAPTSAIQQADTLKGKLLRTLESIAPKDTTSDGGHAGKLSIDIRNADGTPLMRYTPKKEAMTHRLNEEDLKRLRRIADTASVDLLEQTLQVNRWNELVNRFGFLAADASTLFVSSIDDIRIKLPLIIASFLAMVRSDWQGQRRQDITKEQTRALLRDVGNNIKHIAEPDRIGPDIDTWINDVVQGFSDSEQFAPLRSVLAVRTVINGTTLLLTRSYGLSLGYVAGMVASTRCIEELVKENPSRAAEALQHWLQNVKQYLQEEAPYLGLGVMNNLPTLMANIAGGTVGTVLTMEPQRFATLLTQTQEIRDGTMARVQLKKIEQALDFSLSPYKRRVLGQQQKWTTDPGMCYEQKTRNGTRIRRYGRLDEAERSLHIETRNRSYVADLPRPHSKHTKDHTVFTYTLLDTSQTNILLYHDMTVAVPHHQGEWIVEDMSVAFQSGKVHEITDFGTGCHLLLQAMAGNVTYPKGLPMLRLPHGDVLPMTTSDMNAYIYYTDTDASRDHPISFPKNFPIADYLTTTGMFTADEITQYVDHNVVGNTSKRNRLAIAAACAVCYPELVTEQQHPCQDTPVSSWNIIDETPAYPAALLLYTNLTKLELGHRGEQDTDEGIAQFLGRVATEKNVAIIVGQKTANNRLWSALQRTNPTVMGNRYMIEHHQLVPSRS